MPIYWALQFKVVSKPTAFPTLDFPQQSFGLPGNVIYADDLFEAAKHRGDSDFILWTMVTCLLSAGYWEINILDFIYSFIHYKEAILQRPPPFCLLHCSLFNFSVSLSFSVSPHHHHHHCNPRGLAAFLPNWMLFFIFFLSLPNVQIYLNHPQTQSYKLWITSEASFFFAFKLVSHLTYDWQDFHSRHFY